MEADTTGDSVRGRSRHLLRPLSWQRSPYEWTLGAGGVGLQAVVYLILRLAGMQAPLTSLSLVPLLGVAWLGSAAAFAAVAAATAGFELLLTAQGATSWSMGVSRALVIVGLGVLARLAATGYAGARAAASRLALVSRVARVATSSSSLEDILREVLEEMARDGLRGGTILLIDDSNRLYIAAAHGDHLDESVRTQRLEMGQGIMGRVAATAESLLVNDIDAPGAPTPAYRSLGSNARMRSLVSVPMVAAGTVIGVLSVDASQPDRFTPDDVAVLEQIAVAIAGSVQRTGALRLADERLQQRVTELTLLLDTAGRLAESLDLDVVLREVVRSTASAVSHGGGGMGSRASFYRIDEGGWARLIAVEDADESHARASVDFPVAEHPPMLEALRTGRVVNTRLDAAAGIGPSVVEAAQRAGVEVVALVGIASGTAVHGVLVASTRDQRAFDAEELRLLEGIAHLAGLAVGNAHALRLERERAVAAGEHADRMAQVERVKSEFLRLASHELRGPLAVLSGYLSMVDDGSVPPEGLRRVLPVLITKVGEMNRLVDQMLETARLEDGRLRLEREPADLVSLLREAVTVTLPMGAPGHDVVIDAGGPVPVFVDSGRIVTVLANLVGNAVKYSPGGGEVRCAVDYDGDGEVVVRITDEGIGIAGDDLPRLFTRFGRVVTRENSHIAGTGLGLYLSRELARMHGGDITVRSEAGRGSVFTLRLPLSDVHVLRPAVEQ
ncbi:MAG TPA: GAF domain-containing protein [Candidatus Angelobacter sp.]|jgi:signal transduction histidine kinase/putative methionine-R-sulfoxide reductase with GAF domain|nr:GAF domain-containing protein [Candidatus Angelobacter sp.]